MSGSAAGSASEMGSLPVTGGFQVPPSMRRRCDSTQPSASIFVAKVEGAVWRASSGPR